VDQVEGQQPSTAEQPLGQVVVVAEPVLFFQELPYYFRQAEAAVVAVEYINIRDIRDPVHRQALQTMRTEQDLFLVVKVQDQGRAAVAVAERMFRQLEHLLVLLGILKRLPVNPFTNQLVPALGLVG